MPNQVNEPVARGMLSWLWVAAIWVAADQLSKWMAESYLEFRQPIEVIPHLNMTLAYNYGAAFSFLGDQDGWQRWFFAILAIGVSAFIINWLRKLPIDRPWVALGLSSILGGAIGNLFDRLVAGRVTDFIDVYFDIPFYQENYHFATFNIADIGITLGAALLIFISLFASHQLED